MRINKNMNMTLPKRKLRRQTEFHLVNDFHSKLDADKELQKLKNANACFGKKQMFIFTSKNSKIVFKHGIYEQIIFAS